MAKKLSVLEWKARYLFGIPDVDPATSNPFPIEDYQYHLDVAYESLSSILDLPILQESVPDEAHDYYADDYSHWAFLQLFRYPVISVNGISGKFPQNENVISFPSEWLVVDKAVGHVQLLPTGGTISQYLIGSTSLFLPLIARGGYIPGFWHVDYTAGFADGSIPLDLNDAVAKMATMSVCHVLGDLIGGVGVLGASIGLDGLSQFISMTKTATTSAFYARVLQYRTELFGQGGVAGPGSQIHVLKRRYKGIKAVNL